MVYCWLVRADYTLAVRRSVLQCITVCRSGLICAPSLLRTEHTRASHDALLHVVDPICNALQHTAAHCIPRVKRRGYQRKC